VYVNISRMKPSPGYEAQLIDSMHRFSEAARTQAGLTLVTTLRDAGSGDLFGLAVWESEAAARAARPALMEAVSGDDFETWVASMENYGLDEV
jgi:quinol monooxygenase YgiN